MSMIKFGAEDESYEGQKWVIWPQVQRLSTLTPTVNKVNGPIEGERSGERTGGGERSSVIQGVVGVVQRWEQQNVE